LANGNSPVLKMLKFAESLNEVVEVVGERKLLGYGSTKLFQNT